MGGTLWNSTGTRFPGVICFLNKPTPSFITITRKASQLPKHINKMKRTICRIFNGVLKKSGMVWGKTYKQ